LGIEFSLTVSGLKTQLELVSAFNLFYASCEVIKVVCYKIQFTQMTLWPTFWKNALKCKRGT